MNLEQNIIKTLTVDTGKLQQQMAKVAETLKLVGQKVIKLEEEMKQLKMKVEFKEKRDE